MLNSRADSSDLLANRSEPDWISCTQTLVAGMPHLSYGGFSENWLLKECGHIHWNLLARYFNITVPDFRDKEGNRLYAAFVCFDIQNAAFQDVSENNSIEIGSSIHRLSRTQFASSHTVTHKGISVAALRLVSVFLRRTEPRSNHGLARAVVSVDQDGKPEKRFEGFDDLTAASRMLRSRDENWNFFGFSAAKRHAMASFTFAPCPHTDFNGADFLYFASFQSLLDRAEWNWDLACGEIARTEHRQIFYHGNIDVGDRIEVRLLGYKQQQNEGFEFAHWCEFIRLSDGRQIADAFTTRQYSAAVPLPTSPLRSSALQAR